jgi:hypothetical protein
MRIWFGSIATLAFLSAGACTHQRVVTPNYSPQVTAVRPASICPRGEVVSVAVVNQSPAGISAGTTHAGVHTFEYIFASDPALVLRRGLEEALRNGGCQLGSPSAANLGVGILRIEARGLECGFFTCDGTAESMVTVTLSDGAGRPLLQQQMITSNAKRGCGMAICNEEEASAMAAQVLSDTIMKTINLFTGTIARQLAAPPTAPAAPVPSAPMNRS